MNKTEQESQLKGGSEMFKVGDVLINMNDEYGVPAGSKWNVDEIDGDGDLFLSNPYSSLGMRCVFSPFPGNKRFSKPVRRKMKVGDKLKFVGDKPIYSWIELPVGAVVEIAQEGYAFHPTNRYGKNCSLCVAGGGELYDENLLSKCKAWKVIN